jgi:Kef-type K+ transport system membrane component KefB
VKIALLGVFLGVVFLLFRPLAGWFLDRVERKSNGYSYDHIAAVLVAVLVAAAGSVMLGLHGALGAFVAGVALYDRKSLAQAWHRKISPLVDILLVPVFFVFTGTRTQLGQFGVDDLAWCAAWVAAACVSKTLASFFAARLSGMTRTDSLRIGIFLNTRGLTELVVLNVGLDLGLISPKLFTFLVVMALLSTVATVPLLKLLERSWRWRRGALPGSAIEALK